MMIKQGVAEERVEAVGYQSTQLLGIGGTLNM